MPSFTATSPNLRDLGPNVTVQIAVTQVVADSLTADGKPVPAPVQITAQIDTGAGQTVIERGVAAALGLNPVGIRMIGTATSKSVPCPLYAVRLVFPNSVMADLTVIEAPVKLPNIGGLIGRDLLSQAVLVYTGYTNQFTLSF